MSKIHTLEAKLMYILLRLEGALGGPENCRAEMAPNGDPMVGVDCWTGRLAAVCLMARSWY